MGALEAARDLPGQAGGFTRGNRPAFEPRGQRLAVAERHRQERPAVRQFLDVVNGADVRVVERRRGTRFGEQPPLGVLVAHELRRQELQRDEPSQPQVFGFVDHAHPARADFRQDAVVGDGLADHGANPYTRGRGPSPSSVRMSAAPGQAENHQEGGSCPPTFLGADTCRTFLLST